MAIRRRKQNRLTDRRGFLRSSSLSLALPWMESLPVWAESPTAKRTSQTPPLRFACIYFSNGVEPEHWWARAEQDTLRLGPGLAPMQPHVRDMVFLRGLFNEQAREHKSAHLGRVPNLLSGGWVSTDQNVIRCGRTMDQVLASKIGHRTPLRSLVLGIEPTELRLEDGLSMIYGSSISWTSDTKPATKEIYPARVFDQLVGDRRGRRMDRSVLDEVWQDAKQLRGKLSGSDQTKLDEYLGSIRDIEQRIERASQESPTGWRPTLAQPDLERPQNELPDDIPSHMKLMMDLIVLAFQMDKTRIATCMLNNDLSQMNFGFLKGVRGSLHLDLTHNGRDPELEAMYLKTNQFHVRQFAYLVDRLKSIQEGEGTLLDSSLLLCCSNLFDGDRHQADHMPMLLAGNAGGGLRTGRILDYLDEPDSARRACSLYLWIMDRFGVELDMFGDSRSRLARI